MYMYYCFRQYYLHFSHLHYLSCVNLHRDASDVVIDEDVTRGLICACIGYVGALKTCDDCDEDIECALTSFFENFEICWYVSLSIRFIGFSWYWLFTDVSISRT